MKYKYEVAWSFIDFQIRANKIDIKAFCKKKGISYGSFSRILREHTDLKVSNLFLIAEMLKIEDINELLRKVH